MSKFSVWLGRLVWLGLIVASTLTHAVCLDNLARQAPDGRYLMEGETVLDKSTGLRWQRCAFGQIWLAEKSRCQLQPDQQRLFTWGEALTAAAEFPRDSNQQPEGAGLSVDTDNWRLPNKNELESLIDRACTGPALNETAFPDTTLAGFWTSTPARHSDGFAWQIDFATGTLIALATDTKLSVRLVRDANP